MSTIHPPARESGVGATLTLNLRVSVATQVKVTFRHPEDGRIKLVFERTATLHEHQGEQSVIIRTQPFGGAVRLNDPKALQAVIGEFRFDSIRSRDEMDFRIQINPDAWEAVQRFCWEHFGGEDGVLESNPQRELSEEFNDSLKTAILPTQYQLKRIGAVIENQPAKTDNVRAPGNPTVRIYLIFEMHIHDPFLMAGIIQNSQAHQDAGLQRLAWEDYWKGARGRANAVLVVDYEQFVQACLALPAEQPAGLIYFEGHAIETNVLTLLEEVDTSIYRRHNL